MKPEPQASEYKWSWELVAAQIINNRHLKAFLQANEPNQRREIYSILLPLLSFKAKPYILLT